MLLITPEEQYYARSSAIPCRFGQLNELCLLNNMQREYAYRQQQIQKKQIQKLNQPNVEYTQDVNNYHIVLEKAVNRINYQYMSKFNGYELRQIENSLIIKSTRDNFFKNVSLPSDADLEKDITYKLTNNGYRMSISIPKKQVRYQAKTQTFGLPELLGEFFDSEYANKKQDSDEKKLNYFAGKSNGDRIRIPITYHDNHEETKVETKKPQLETLGVTAEKTKKIVVASEKQHEPAKQATVEQQSEITNHLSKLLVNSLADNVESANSSAKLQKLKKIQQSSQKQVEPSTASVNASLIEHMVADPLMNYNTIQRKTVFLPDTMQNDESADISITDSEFQSDTEAIPVRRTLSPTLEDVVDQEFL